MKEKNIKQRKYIYIYPKLRFKELRFEQLVNPYPNPNRF